MNVYLLKMFSILTRLCLFSNVILVTGKVSRISIQIVIYIVCMYSSFAVHKNQDRNYQSTKAPWGSLSTKNKIPPFRTRSTDFWNFVKICSIKSCNFLNHKAFMKLPFIYHFWLNQMNKKKILWNHGKDLTPMWTSRKSLVITLIFPLHCTVVLT